MTLWLLLLAILVYLPPSSYLLQWCIWDYWRLNWSSWLINRSYFPVILSPGTALDLALRRGVTMPYTAYLGRAGFEPALTFISGFTIRPHKPLGHRPNIYNIEKFSNRRVILTLRNVQNRLVKTKTLFSVIWNSNLFVYICPFVLRITYTTWKDNWQKHLFYGIISSELGVWRNW